MSIFGEVGLWAPAAALALRFAENQVEDAILASRSRLPEQFLGHLSFVPKTVSGEFFASLR